MSHIRIRIWLSPAKIPIVYSAYPAGTMWSRATQNMWCRAFDPTGDPTGCVTERRPLGLVYGDQMINLMCSFLVALSKDAREGLSCDRVPSLPASWQEASTLQTAHVTLQAYCMNRALEEQHRNRRAAVP